MALNRFNVIDLFAGAGGFSLGFENANYNILYSLEVDKWAAETLQNNFIHNVINKNILEFETNKNIVSLTTQRPDIIIGGPPCQGFSNAGKRSITDPRNKMYLHFFRWVKLYLPQIFVIENVRGILTFKNGKGEKVIEEIKEKFSEIGYNINVWQLSSENYGVPQKRRRVFIVGNLKSDKIPPPPITHSNNSKLLKPLTVGEAILDLPSIRAREGAEIMEYSINPQNEYQELLRAGCLKVYNHEAMKHTERMVSRYQHIIDGNRFEDLDDSLKVRKRNGDGVLSHVKFGLNYRYLNPSLPSFTIPAHFYSSFIHPQIPRNITTREAARIQSFPDRYRFYGKRTLVSSKLLKRLGKDQELNYLSQYNQVGNAVPPLLAKAIAEHLKQFLL